MIAGVITRLSKLFCFDSETQEFKNMVFDCFCIFVEGFPLTVVTELVRQTSRDPVLHQQLRREQPPDENRVHESTYCRSRSVWQ